jgi:hypothetical protein
MHITGRHTACHQPTTLHTFFAGISHASNTTIATVIIGSESPTHDPELSLNNATMNSLFVSPSPLQKY